jgi:hypothetical protein
MMWLELLAFIWWGGRAQKWWMPGWHTDGKRGWWGR